MNGIRPRSVVDGHVKRSRDPCTCGQPQPTRSTVDRRENLRNTQSCAKNTNNTGEGKWPWGDFFTSSHLEVTFLSDPLDRPLIKKRAFFSPEAARGRLPIKVKKSGAKGSTTARVSKTSSSVVSRRFSTIETSFGKEIENRRPWDPQYSVLAAGGREAAIGTACLPQAPRTATH